MTRMLNLHNIILSNGRFTNAELTSAQWKCGLVDGEVTKGSLWDAEWQNYDSVQHASILTELPDGVSRNKVNPSMLTSGKLIEGKLAPNSKITNAVVKKCKFDEKGNNPPTEELSDAVLTEVQWRNGKIIAANYTANNGIFDGELIEGELIEGELTFGKLVDCTLEGENRFTKGALDGVETNTGGLLRMQSYSG